MSAIAAAAILAGVHAEGEIEVGGHAETVTILGLTINLDIVWASLFAAAVVLALGFLVRGRVSDGVPGKLQLFWEVLIEQVQELTDSAIGVAKGRKFVPLGVTIFIFLLICNWMEVIPSGHNPEWLPAPTSDVNLPAAMAIAVIVIVHVNSIRARGVKGYFKHYLTPYPVMLPINIIEEITKPITLTFRLFGNIFASTLMVSVMVALLPVYVVPVGELIWKPFAMFVGAIQAFIFALLTIIYLSIGMSTDEH